MKKLFITRPIETVAYEWYSCILEVGGHSFALLAKSPVELRLLWEKIADIEFDINKVQRVCVVEFQERDKL